MRISDWSPDVCSSDLRSFYNRMCDSEWNTPIGEAEACGGDAMFRVDALTEAKGYDPAIIAGEEPELCHRLRGRGWRVWRIDSPMTIHDADMHRPRQWWMRTVRSGFGYRSEEHTSELQLLMRISFAVFLLK